MQELIATRAPRNPDCPASGHYVVCYVWLKGLSAQPSRGFNSRPRFSDCDWIGLAPDRLWYLEQKKWLDMNVECPARFRFNTMPSICDACCAGAGLAVLPCFIADANDNLKRVCGGQEILHSVENLIVHRDLLREPAVRSTVDVIARLYKKSKNALMDRSAKVSIAS